MLATSRVDERRASTAPLAPILNFNALEPRKILDVDSHEYQIVHERDRSDLTVNVRRWFPQPLKPGALVTVPVRRLLSIGKNRERSQNYVLQVGLQRLPTFPARQSVTPIRELVPHRRGDRALMPSGFQMLHNFGIRHLRYRRGHDACVEQISNTHSDTLRPAPASRTISRSASSSPTSLNRCDVRNRPYTSPNGARSPRSRATSRSETTTATALPRRVSSIS